MSKLINDEHIGLYPEDWSLGQLRDVGEFFSGSTPSTQNDKYWNGDIVWLVPSDLTALSDSTNFIFDSDSKITTEGLRSCSTHMLPIGTLCISSRATLGEAVVAGVELCTNQGFINLITSHEYDALYLLYWVKQNEKYISRFAAGTTFLEIGRRTFRNIKLALPKLPEQKAIATILSIVDESIKATENSILSAERLKKSLMQNLLTGKLKPDGTWRSEDDFYIDEKFRIIPKGWQLNRVKDLTNRVTDGEHLSPDFQTSGSYLLSAEDVHDDGISLAKAKFVKYKDCLKFRNRCDPDFGDVLIVSRGASIGRTCKVNLDIEFCLMGSVILIKPKNELLIGGYLAQYFKSHTAWVELQKLSGTTAQQAIYLTHINKVKLIYPSDLKEQLNITKALESFDVDIASKKSKIQTLGNLKKSLMQNLLTGKVRVDVDKINKLLDKA